MEARCRPCRSAPQSLLAADVEALRWRASGPLASSKALSHREMRWCFDGHTHTDPSKVLCSGRHSGGLYRTVQGAVDYSRDFFGRPAYLTVSGQMQGEFFATALSNVYTFGPTFRAEGGHQCVFTDLRSVRHLPVL